MTTTNQPGRCSIELSVKIKTVDPFSGELKESGAADYKLSKEDLIGGNPGEEWFSISVEPGSKPDLSDAKINVSAHSRYSVSQTIPAK